MIFREEYKVTGRDQKGVRMYKLVGKLNRLKSTFKELNRERFKDVKINRDLALHRLKLSNKTTKGHHEYRIDH